MRLAEFRDLCLCSDKGVLSLTLAVSRLPVLLRTSMECWRDEMAVLQLLENCSIFYRSSTIPALTINTVSTDVHHHRLLR